jgi:hypothetical protein
MSIFGVVYLEFCFKAWTLCLMCTLALLYSNMQMNHFYGQFEFSKQFEYIFAKLGILL